MAQDFLARSDALAQARTALADAHAAVARGAGQRGAPQRRAAFARAPSRSRRPHAGASARCGGRCRRAGDRGSAQGRGGVRIRGRRRTRGRTGVRAARRPALECRSARRTGCPSCSSRCGSRRASAAASRRPSCGCASYPDDCLVDRFEEQLSDAEIDAGERYWCGCWRAGGDEDRERAAWRALVAGHGSGRAAWIASQLRRSRPPPTGRHETRPVTSSSPSHCAQSSTQPRPTPCERTGSRSGAAPVTRQRARPRRRSSRPRRRRPARPS